MLQPKAYCNSLRLNAEEPSEEWAVENLRPVPLEELWKRLEKLPLNEREFYRCAQEHDTPEELALHLLGEGALFNKFYLILFELWRRLFPERQSASIFGDELDFRISLYDEGAIQSDEAIQDVLANLKEILDENVDAGATPSEAFQWLSEHCAHDIEAFLYDYIDDLLEAGNSWYASELIEGFIGYVSEPVWFEFLRAKWLSASDVGEANALFATLLQRNLSPALLFEMLHFLAGTGDRALFILAVQKLSPFLKTHGELLELLSITSEYYRRLDRDSLENAIQKLICRIKLPSTPLHPTDPEFMAFIELFFTSDKGDEN